MPDMVNPSDAAKRAEGYVVGAAPRLKPPDPRLGKKHGRNAKKLRDLTQAQRRMTFCAMYSKGDLLKDIAKKHGVSPEYVGQEIDKVVRQLEVQAMESMSRKRARSEHVYAMVALEATLSWYASKKGVRTHSVKNVRSGFKRVKSGRAKEIKAALDAAFGPDEGDSPTLIVSDDEEETTRHEESVGNPRFLEIIMEAQGRIDRMNKIYGENGETGGDNGGLLGGEEVKRLSTDERDRLLSNFREKAALQRARQLALAGETDPVGQIIEAEVVTRPTVIRQPVPVRVAHVEESASEEDDEWLS